jgi:hypothetical protein
MDHAVRNTGYRMKLRVKWALDIGRAAMKKVLGGAMMCILGWAFATILLVFFIQARDFYGANPIMRPRQGTIEAFQMRVQDSEDPNFAGMKPGDPGLNKPADSYNLLSGWLNPLEKPMYPTAKKCHELDFQTRLERTGNFRQMTNNYKRGDPDSCSAPIQDMTLAFYKTDPVPQTGCIQPFVE